MKYRRTRFWKITYNSIKGDLGSVIQEIKRFANLQFSPELNKRLKEIQEQQPSYNWKHMNLPLEAFNLREERIKSDFDFVFKRYESK